MRRHKRPIIRNEEDIMGETDILYRPVKNISYEEMLSHTFYGYAWKRVRTCESSFRVSDEFAKKYMRHKRIIIEDEDKMRYLPINIKEEMIISNKGRKMQTYLTPTSKMYRIGRMYQANV